MKKTLLLVALFTLFAAASCDPDPPISCSDCGGQEEQGRDITGPSSPTAYELEVPDFMPRPIVDESNPMTVEGIALGRRLFYDKIMGRDSAFACADCHQQDKAFTDGRALAVGIDGRESPRSAMSIVNLAFNADGFNWDGASTQLWEQAIHPVENILEMDEDWERVLERLRNHTDYPERFRAAFGIDNTEQITQEMTVKAIAQFERTIISADSHFDRYFYLNTEFPTEEEQFGGDSLFFVENVPVGALHPGCGHCHNRPSFGDNKFKNNGLDDVDHYASGGHGVENEDPNITGFPLNDREKAALLAFMRGLTDETMLTDERYSDPF